MRLSTRSLGNVWELRHGSSSLLLAFILALSASCPALLAQTPNPAAIGPASKGNNEGGFTPGWTLGTRFEGSYSGSNGSVYDLGSAVGYNFSRHFAVDA